MPWFVGCRCCHVTTRKLTPALKVKWNGDWGDTVSPDTPRPSKFPNDSETSIVLTDIAVDSQGRVWNTGTVYVQDSVAKVYDVTAKEFAAANGRLTGRTFDWNEDNQGTVSFANLNAVAIDSADDIFFGGQRVAGVNGKILTNDLGTVRYSNFNADGDIAALDADRDIRRFYGTQSIGSDNNVFGIRVDPFDGWSFEFDFPDPTGSSNVLDVSTEQDGLGVVAVAYSTVFSTGLPRLHVLSAGQTGDNEGQAQIASNTGFPRCIAKRPGGFAIGFESGSIADQPSKVRGYTGGGTLLWGFDTGGLVLDIAADPDGNVYAVTGRIENHTPTRHDHAGNLTDTFPEVAAGTLWKLDTNGNLLAVFDHGQTLRAVTYRDGFVYVCGDRANGGGKTVTL